MIIYDNEFLPQAGALIESAKQSIDICTFKVEFTSHHRGRNLMAFYQKVFDKRASGVKVRFMMNWNTERRACPSTNKSAVSHFKKNKIIPRILPRNRCCHAKIVMVDAKKAIVGSHNLSVASCSRNFEVSYLVHDQIAVTALQMIFNAIYKASSTI